MPHANPYSLSKLVHHPEVVDRLRQGLPETLILVHLMPQNLCNQRCQFCSYRMPANKNSKVFDDGAQLSINALKSLVTDFARLGVKAVEVTGGGEPLAYRYRDEMFRLLFDHGFDVGLVTNGTLLTPHLATTLASNLAWVRVSIDAADEATYARLRATAPSQFRRALGAIQQIREAENHRPEFRLGAGFVVANGNEHQVYDFCALVKENGADNVRLSLTFSDQGVAFFRHPALLEEALRQGEQAVVELQDDSFQVFNQLPRRMKEIRESRNDYPYCFAKDTICVIEGSGLVYTCCTFAGSEHGILGNIHDHAGGFEGVWRDSAKFRKHLDPRRYCQVPCLYREKNLEMLSLVREGRTSAADADPPAHVNFI